MSLTRSELLLTDEEMRESFPKGIEGRWEDCDAAREAQLTKVLTALAAEYRERAKSEEDMLHDAYMAMADDLEALAQQ